MRAWALLALWPALAQAQSTEWDGLSRWLGALERAELRVEQSAEIDLAALPAESGLALVTPVEVAHPEALRTFVRNGGRLLILAEDAADDPLLAPFDARVVPAPEDGERVGGHPALHHLRTDGRGLFANAEHLVANRPAALEAPARFLPAIRFADGRAFAYHLQTGAGEVLLIADASLLINLMLDGGDNARLAANLGSWLTRSGRTTAYIAADGARVKGRPAPSDEAPPQGVGAVDQALAEMAEGPAPAETAVHLIAALLLLATLAYVLTVFPGARTRGEVRPPPDVTGGVERAAGLRGGPASPE